MRQNIFGLPVVLLAVLALALLGGGGYYFTKSNSLATKFYSGDSGIYGKATLGPTCPVQREGEECSRPYLGEIVVKSSDGKREITKLTTDSVGQFRIKLPPGRYSLSVPSKNRFPFMKEQTIEVIPNKYTEASLNLDTGIR